MFFVTAHMVKPVNSDELPNMRGMDGLKGSSPLGVEPKGEGVSGQSGYKVSGQKEETPTAAPAKVDEPKTKTSHDGERWWGSNFGKEVTIAAPGVHNYTTDITGPGGYNTGTKDPNYIPDFNGTSSATPIVAGAVGLVLSANPKLTEAQVRKILIDTADKVGGVTYDAKTKRNDRMGHGRLNVQAAVERALALARN